MKKICRDPDKTNMDRASLRTSSYSSFYTLLHSKMNSTGFYMIYIVIDFNIDSRTLMWMNKDITENRKPTERSDLQNLLHTTLTMVYANTYKKEIKKQNHKAHANVSNLPINLLARHPSSVNLPTLPSTMLQVMVLVLLKTWQLLIAHILKTENHINDNDDDNSNDSYDYDDYNKITFLFLWFCTANVAVVLSKACSMRPKASLIVQIMMFPTSG
uniref:Uncharacterized protein n=1 Tax=Glossina austeni TaxID=7395 RepID=A0A1A9VD70_GLOAU